ncbi:MAG TPA: hypothetical protein VLA89_13095 [Gemmatimonadales bacterium]|nr:hypothetical protein [Gemmatimonadales bacterium]
MTNIYRGRWDAMANPKSEKQYGVLAADPIEIGDLCWFDKRTQTVKAFSHADAWTGTTDGSQGKVAENFVGVARSAHVANDSTLTTVQVEARGVYEFVLTTAALLEVGDLVTASKNPSFSLLFAQQVDKGALGAADEPTSRAREIAIGKVAVRYQAATTSKALIEILGTREAGGGPRQFLLS